MQDKIKQTLKNTTAQCILIYACIVIVYHMFMQHYDGDIEFYLRASWTEPVWNLQALYKLLLERYYTVTSRVLLEGAVFVFTHGMHVWVWNIFDVTANMIIYIGLTRLTDHKHDRLLLCLLLLYPIAEMNTAGWIVCYIIYFWPLAAAIVSFNSLKDMYEEKPIRIFPMILYLLCLIFATNLEQFAFLYLAILILFTAYMITEHRFTPRYTLFTILQYLAVAGNLIFSLTGLGNHGKITWLREYWFPDYISITFADKVVIAVNTTMSYLIDKSLIWLVLCALIAMFVALKDPGNIFRITVSAIPLISALLRSVAGFFSGTYYTDFTDIFNLYSGTARVDSTNYNSPSAYIPFIFYMAIATIILICLIWIADDMSEAVFCVCMMLFAYGMHAMIAFSPTIYATSSRTFMVTEFLIIYLIMRLYAGNNDYLIKLPGSLQTAGRVSVYLLVTFTVINNLLSVTNAYYYGW